MNDSLILEVTRCKVPFWRFACGWGGARGGGGGIEWSNGSKTRIDSHKVGMSDRNLMIWSPRACLAGYGFAGS